MTTFLGSKGLVDPDQKSLASKSKSALFIEQPLTQTTQLPLQQLLSIPSSGSTLIPHFAPNYLPETDFFVALPPVKVLPLYPSHRT